MDQQIMFGFCPPEQVGIPFVVMISHYATRGRRLPLLAVLEEATSESSTRVLVFILTVNNDWSQIHRHSFLCGFPVDQGSGEVVCVSLALILLAFSGASPIITWVYNAVVTKRA